MDFRMEKSSWLMLLAIIVSMAAMVVSGAGGLLTTGSYFWVIIYALLVTLALVAMCSIPVLIYCYIVKKIPDIDYSINLATIVALVVLLMDLF